MARQNIPPPKGAFPYPRSPLAETAPHDPAHMPSHEGYPQSYEPPGQGAHPYPAHAPDHGDHRAAQSGAPRDIFNALRPDQGLTSRLEAFTTPAGGRFDPSRQDAYGHGHAAPAPVTPRAQDAYGRGGYPDPAGQPYPAPGAYGHGEHEYDPYGRPLPAGTNYPSQGGAYPAEGAASHDPRHYGGHHTEPAFDLASRYPQGQSYAAGQDPYGRHDAHGYDDSYRTDVLQQPYGAQAALPGAAPGAEAEYYADDYADDGEVETRRGPRAIVVVGALIAAIGLGGGLAYGYKSLTSGGAGGGKLPILRAEGAPAKALPTDPGGKQIAHTDKKFINRLTEERGAARPVPVSILPPPASEREASSDGGTRRVPTLVVNRDGSLAPTSSVPSAAPPPPVNRVPGMVIEGLAPRTPQQPPPLREAQRSQPSQPPPFRATVVEELKPEPVQPTPRRVASAQPAAAADVPPAAASIQPRAEPESKRRPPAVRQAARTTSDAGSPAAVAPTGTAGYVAVLSSRKSHMDALKAFADIQQKHSGVLQGRTPDVREANLGEKGIWFRVVVGPPGSRESANSVCSQLKAQGYTGCWIMTY
jgi:hypothetical protein